MGLDHTAPRCVAQRGVAEVPRRQPRRTAQSELQRTTVVELPSVHAVRDLPGRHRASGGTSRTVLDASVVGTPDLHDLGAERTLAGQIGDAINDPVPRQRSLFTDARDLRPTDGEHGSAHETDGCCDEDAGTADVSHASGEACASPPSSPSTSAWPSPSPSPASSRSLDRSSRVANASVWRRTPRSARRSGRRFRGMPRRRPDGSSLPSGCRAAITRPVSRAIISSDARDERHVVLDRAAWSQPVASLDAAEQRPERLGLTLGDARTTARRAGGRWGDAASTPAEVDDARRAGGQLRLNLSRNAPRSIRSISSSTRSLMGARAANPRHAEHGRHGPAPSPCARGGRASVSPTVSDANNLQSWNERPTRRVTRRSGASLGDVGRPPDPSATSSGDEPRRSRRTAVVLPAPFGPISPRISPCSTSKLTSSTATTPTESDRERRCLEDQVRDGSSWLAAMPVSSPFDGARSLRGTPDVQDVARASSSSRGRAR